MKKERVQHKEITAVACLIAAVMMISMLPTGDLEAQQRETIGNKKIIGVHVLVESIENGDQLVRAIPALAKMGFNTVIVELDYNYEYESHPELRGKDPVTKETVKKIVKLCRENGLRLIPEFQSLGHQSWAKDTWALLTKYPQFDETPGRYPDNDSIYCRSWCPLNPDVNPIVFSLYDELLDVCEAKALHVGMDEVFLIGEDDCPRCKGKTKAELFAKAVNDIYDHLVKKRGVEMLMWGDRLLDTAATGYGPWDGSANQTAPAIDMIPKDIIICDWHYDKRDSYRSVPLLTEKGFRILPSSWRDPVATEAFVDYSLQFNSDKMLGHLCTLWSEVRLEGVEDNPSFKVVTQKFKALETK